MTFAGDWNIALSRKIAAGERSTIGRNKAKAVAVQPGMDLISDTAGLESGDGHR